MSFKYEGSELDLFRVAEIWKSYWASLVIPHVKGRVLEVGAGIGTNTISLTSIAQYDEWVALEPDQEMCTRMREIPSLATGRKVSIVHGDVAKLEQKNLFDTILYIDVLEHIRDDQLEIEKAAKLLNPGGNLIVLSPAYEWLYSPFDRAIGHVRRYNQRSLRSAVGSEMFSEVSIRHLDACGILLSAANRFITRKSAPKPSDLLFWDRFVVPVSKFIDPLLGYSVGKSILGVWRRL